MKSCSLKGFQFRPRQIEHNSYVVLSVDRHIMINSFQIKTAGSLAKIQVLISLDVIDQVIHTSNFRQTHHHLISQRSSLVPTTNIWQVKMFPRWFKIGSTVLFGKQYKLLFKVATIVKKRNSFFSTHLENILSDPLKRM